MQQRNLLFFFIVSVCMMGAWYYFLAPTDLGKTNDKDRKEIAQNKDQDKDKDKKKVDEKKPPEKKIDKKEPEIKKDPEKKKDPVKVVEPQAPPKHATIGGEGFHLTVDLTERGAGVRKVQLNEFKQADWRGRPTGRVFELIQDDEFSPSYRMYHYAEAADLNPVFGLGEQTWTIEGESKKGEARFWTTVPEMKHIKIVKTYRVEPKDYHVTLLLEFHDLRTERKEKTLDFRYQLVGAHGLPIEGEWYTSIYRNAFMGLVDPRNSLFRKQEDSARISGRKGGDRFPGSVRADNRLQYAGVANQFFAAMILPDDNQPKRDEGGVPAGEILAWARPTLASTEKRGLIQKIARDRSFIEFNEGGDLRKPPDKYFLLPRVKQHFEDLEIVEGELVTLSFYETDDHKRVATWVRQGKTPRPQFDDITMRVSSEVIPLSPGDVVKHQFMLYHGPIKVALLNQFTGDEAVPTELVDRYTHTLHLRTLTDYPSDNWFGWASSKIMLTDLIILVTRFMHWLLNLLHYVFGYGLSIVVLTVMVRGAMFPISRKQAIFSIKMQEMAPELKKIQDKYPDDPQAKMQATQEFYRKNGINPLGSCWPVFLQMPIFLGLYFALQESIHFRLAEFLWMKNLAAPDMLIWWSEQIPYISDPDNLGGLLYLGPFLNILPMIAVVFMMIQQMQTMPPPTDEQQAMQQKMLKFMTIFFGIMFYKVAAGLCIYFISSSLWGMAERKLLPKKKGTAVSAAGIGASSAVNSKASLAPKGKGKNWKKEKEREKELDKPATTFDKIKNLWQEILRQAEKK